MLYLAKNIASGERREVSIKRRLFGGYKLFLCYKHDLRPDVRTKRLYKDKEALLKDWWVIRPVDSREFIL